MTSFSDGVIMILTDISDTINLVEFVLALVEIADKPLSKKKQGRIHYWHGSYEITKISQRAIVQVELYPFKISKGGVKSESKIFHFSKKRCFR